MPKYDALLVVSFGGPEGRDDVLPFLENVLRGKNVPRERMLEVAEHYQHFGGVSPINAQNRALIEALGADLAKHGPQLPIYWGNRNWQPFLNDTLRRMADDGIRRALAFFTSAYSSYSGCRQYRENLQEAMHAIETETPHLKTPHVDKLRVFYNHPGFIAATASRVSEALSQVPEERREQATLVFTAHSIPQGMADNCRYETQFKETATLVCEYLKRSKWRVAYQSRSGPPSQPWLEPDILNVLREIAAGGATDVAIAPIGFISDHMEVLYDLDTEAAGLCHALGINLVRAQTVGTHPRFVRMIRELITERMTESPDRAAVGQFGPSHDVCPADCCLPAVPAARPATAARAN